MFNVISFVVVTILVLIAIAVHQNKEDLKELAAAPPLVVDACYAFSDHISLGKNNFPLFKVTGTTGGKEYTEVAWLPEDGWQEKENISERNSTFYTKVNCPKPSTFRNY